MIKLALNGLVQFTSKPLELTFFMGVLLNMKKLVSIVPLLNEENSLKIIFDELIRIKNDF